jgi:hypothetical protein
VTVDIDDVPLLVHGEQPRSGLYLDPEVERSGEVHRSETFHEKVEDADGQDPEPPDVVVDVGCADGAAADLAEVYALDEAGYYPGGRHGAQEIRVEEYQRYL